LSEYPNLINVFVYKDKCGLKRHSHAIRNANGAVPFSAFNSVIKSGKQFAESFLGKSIKLVGLSDA
jgi:hypothetical protein